MEKSIDKFILAGDKEAKERNFTLAIEHYKKYLEKNPNDALLYNRIGFMYKNIDEVETLDLQIQYYKKALELRPNYTGAIRNLAFAYEKIGKYEHALACFKSLFKLGAIIDDYFAYACLKIQMGDFGEGWKYYETRFVKDVGRTEYPVMSKPRWEGQQISGKTLLVQYEQGFGDTIQFCRFLEQVKPLVGKIIFRVQREVFDLMKNSLQGIEVVSVDTEIKDLAFDYHTPLMSLPLLLKTQMNTIPGYKEPLKAERSKVEKYKNKYFNNDCLKIGISWSGRQTGNLSRNVPLNFFYPLAELPNVQLYSFQKGAFSRQLQNVPKCIKIIDLGETFEDFSDTAAAMANVDLFVTSDNSVFNLAGAMGVKTFLLLNKYPEWRWFFDENTTPWYDSVRIFKKQDVKDVWSLVMQKVLSEVTNIASH